MKLARGMILGWSVCSRWQWPLVLSPSPPTANPSCAHTASRAGVVWTRQQSGLCLKKQSVPCLFSFQNQHQSRNEEWGTWMQIRVGAVPKKTCVESLSCLLNVFMNLEDTPKTLPPHNPTPPSPPYLCACLTGGWRWPQRCTDLHGVIIPKKHFHPSEAFLICTPRHTTAKAAEKLCPDLEGIPAPSPTYPLPHASLMPWMAKCLAEKGWGASWGATGKALHWSSSVLQTQMKGKDAS